MARETELQIEYAPTPLFGVGTPELAGPALTRRALANGMGEGLSAVADRAARRLGVTAAAVG